MKPRNFSALPKETGPDAKQSVRYYEPDFRAFRSNCSISSSKFSKIASSISVATQKLVPPVRGYFKNAGRSDRVDASDGEIISGLFPSHIFQSHCVHKSFQIWTRKSLWRHITPPSASTNRTEIVMILRWIVFRDIRQFERRKFRKKEPIPRDNHQIPNLCRHDTHLPDDIALVLLTIEKLSNFFNFA
ncbi:unnamed protein product [Albugo candida]|uniref:Uncharacterized protein n=1 Tax=Albugo candida TaxID=65357 RepID=A0A024FVI1_9STRA|nr:unnamed protein product [Albugo candida]|eukprot:CCI11173.1 unnamed protein product [Albugo candida]